MPPVRIDVNDHTDVPLAQASAFAAAAEAGGLDGVGVHDHQVSGHDVFVRLTLMAQGASRVTLFPSVTNPVTRHPAVLAAAGNSLAEIAPGRIRLMMGSGDLATSSVGLKPATIATMREATLAIRALWQGESATFQGKTLQKLHHVSEQRPTLFINASSPRTLECAGEAADGVYAMVGIRPEVIQRAREHVADGAQRARRSIDDVPIALGVPIYMGDSREEALEGIRPYTSSNFNSSTKVFASVIREVYPDLPAVSDPSHLSPDTLATVADALGIVGTPAECGARLATFLTDAQPGHIVCRIFYAGADPMRALDALVNTVLPAARS
ncbi:MAG: LLM class flavin-dependent oxidoreductase [Chloroflexi bacterium]|nr:LLM class flavin-dependent oxidoreductase [Chloroflexota bacterium]